MSELSHMISTGDKYGPAMQIAEQSEADAYFERCVQHCMKWGNARDEAERIERANLGYYAGYYSNETRRRVERLFRCAHPVFGSIEQRGAPTQEEALRAGMALGKERAAISSSHEAPPASSNTIGTNHVPTEQRAGLETGIAHG